MGSTTQFSIENQIAMKLEYINEDDKAYGLAGMAVSLAALDAIDRIVNVSLDAQGPMVTFSNEFYFSSSPMLSPKATWNHMLQNFYITSAMVMANVMSRSMVRMKKDVPADLLGAIRQEMALEAKEICSLEDDEIDNIFEKTRMQMGRIFRNPRIHPAIDDFARTLARKRILSGNEIVDELRMLSII